MKRFVLLTLFIIPAIAMAQTQKDMLAGINSEEDARAFMKGRSLQDASLLKVRSDAVQSELSKTILSHEKGDVFKVAGYEYKILESSVSRMFRCSYIFINGSILSKNSIDSLRSVIIAELKNGAAFAKLVARYNMDGNTTGDLDWFAEGAMMKEFEEAVAQHKKGDIFTVDVTSNGWYYVVQKTFDTKTSKEMKVIRLKNGN